MVVVLRPSHVAVCETLLTSRQTLLFVAARRHDAGNTATQADRQCGSSSRPWTIAAARHGQRINVTIVDLAQPPSLSADAAAAAASEFISASGDSCHRYAHFSEPEIVSPLRDRCDVDDGRRNSAAALGETPLYSSQTGRIKMVLDRQTSAAFLLIFTGL